MYTILGASGFIGAHVTRALRDRGEDVFSPARNEESWWRRDLGNVIDCVGLTADFRRRPLETVEAHVSFVHRLLREASFSSLLYLSSARIYRGAERGIEEARISVDPASPNDLYDISKIMGEALCLSSGKSDVRVVRLSNVVGPGDRSESFVASLVRDAVHRGAIRLETSLESEKDYVLVEDVARVLPRIAESGRERVYNVAGGRNVSHREIVERIAMLTSCRVEIAPRAPTVRLPEISIARVSNEFGFAPRPVIEDLPAIVQSFRDEAR